MIKEFDKIYIAKYCENIDIGDLAKGLYTTKNQIESVIKQLKENGLYQIYKNISDSEWERLENKSDKYIKEKYQIQQKETQKQIFNNIVNIFKKELELEFQQTIKSFPVYRLEKQGFDRNYFKEEDYQGEEWKKIGKLNYQISNYGRIKNITTKKLKQLKFNKYGMQVLLWQNSKSYTVTISRLVAEMFIRPVNKNEKVFHINENIRDNYYKNLKIVQI